MGLVKSTVSGVDWGAPSPVLAVLAVLLLVAVGGKRRFRPTFVVSSLAGGAGFLAGGWFGVLTFAMALSYRVFQRLRAPWQAVVTVTAGVSGFVVGTWLVQWLDPAATAERGSGRLSGVFGGLVAVTDAVATHRVWGVVCAVVGAGLAWWVWRSRVAGRGSAFDGEGAGLPPVLFYRGRVNPDLSPVGEEWRDPQRSFTAKMRQAKLKEQRGLCAFQGVVRSHPVWEPFRQGVSWEGDHRVPHASGGATNFENLQVLCAECNSAKGSAFGREAERRAEARWRKVS